jgi:hypothetical protein
VNTRKQVNLTGNAGLTAFDNHLPIYNWIHPMSGEESKHQGEESEWVLLSIWPIFSG